MLPENIMFQLVFYYNGYGSHLSSLWILYTPNQGQIGKWPCSYFWINTNIVKHIEIKYILIGTEGALKLPMLSMLTDITNTCDMSYWDKLGQKVERIIFATIIAD